MSPTDPIAAASKRYLKLQAAADKAKKEFFDLCAQVVEAGRDTADTIAPRSFPTAVTIRKELRARGVEPLSRGPRTRKTPPASESE